MVAIHGKFMGDDAETDVITFAGDVTMGFAGEICVSPNYAMENHGIHGMTFAEELALYLIHGYLHLFGLDDIATSDTVRMRGGEKYCIAFLRKKNSMTKFAYSSLCPCKKQNIN
jgi:probable rRNA maturation factor